MFGRFFYIICNISINVKIIIIGELDKVSYILIVILSEPTRQSIHHINRELILTGVLYLYLGIRKNKKGY